MVICYLQHVPFEGLGNIADWAKENNHECRAVRLFAGEYLPDPNDADLFIVLGGPMNVDEEARFPFLRAEKRFIRRVVEQEKPLLGICLGAQLVASVLGAPVFASGEREIGWFPVECEAAPDSKFADLLPASFETFHWHGDAFDLPDGARRLASSAMCRNQAFAYGERVLGLQFHLEATAESVSLMTDNEADEIESEIFSGAKFVQTIERVNAPDNPFAENAIIMCALLDALAGNGK